MIARNAAFFASAQLTSGLLLSLAVLAGCEQGPKKPTLYPVIGELFVKGQPATGAKVILHPLENADPALWKVGYPRAVVDAEGKFQIESYDPQDGAPPGKYKVLANWMSGEDGQEEDPNAQRRVNQIDPKFNVPETSPWVIEVKPESNLLPRIDVP